MSHSSIRANAGLPLLVRHIAARFGVAERTVRWWAKTGRLRGRRLAIKIWGFDEYDVVEFDRRRRQEAV